MKGLNFLLSILYITHHKVVLRTYYVLFVVCVCVGNGFSTQVREYKKKGLDIVEV